MLEKKLESLEKRLIAVNDSLTKTDKKILDFLQRDPEGFAKLSITKLAEKLETSVAAITRFVRRLGYDKLTDLKLAISKDTSTTIQKQYNDIKKSDDVDVIASKVLSRNIEAIHDVGHMLKKDELEKALEYLITARRILFTGIGGSASVAQDAYHKFRRLGLVVELVTDVNSQMIFSSVASKEDLIVVISNEGANKELNLALKIAKDNGIKIIAITQFSNSPLERIADINLMTLSHGYYEKPEPLISRIASYSLIDVIFVLYCMKSKESIDGRLVKITENMKLLKSYSN